MARDYDRLFGRGSYGGRRDDPYERGYANERDFGRDRRSPGGDYGRDRYDDRRGYDQGYPGRNRHDAGGYGRDRDAGREMEEWYEDERRGVYRPGDYRQRSGYRDESRYGDYREGPAYERRLRERAPDYDLNDRTRGAYDRGFYDRGGPENRTWIGDREAGHYPRMDYPEDTRGGEFRRPREYDVEGRYGRGRNKDWGDREGRAQPLRNSNVW